MSNISGLANITAHAGHRVLWYQHEECAVAPFAFIFYFAVKIFNLALGFPANVLVMWHILARKTESSTTDVFVFNLATLDSFFCLMTPIELTNRLYLNHRGVWHLQQFAYGVKDTAALFLTCICLDRYLAVVHPIMFTNIRDNCIRASISALVWAMILAYAISKSILGVVSVTGVFSGIILSAFIVMVFCNISIIWVLRRSVMGKEVMNPVKKKAFKVVIILLVIIMVNYLPPVACMPFASTYTFIQMHCQISISVFSIMDLSSTIEPILYISRMDKLNACSCLRANKTVTVNV